MLPENDRFRDILGVTAWHKAGYTGRRGLAASGEDFTKDEYHKRATLFVFREIAPDSGIIYPLSGTSVNVLGVGAMRSATQTIAMRQIDAMFGSYSGGERGEEYDDILRPVSGFCTIFFSAGNNAEGGYNPALRSEYIYGAGAVNASPGGAVTPEPYTSVTDYVDFCAPAGLFVAYKGSKMPFGGTSCAAPVLAGMARLVNDLFIEKTGAPLPGAEMYRFFAENCMDIYAPGRDDRTGLGMPVLPPPKSVDVWRYQTMFQSTRVDLLRADVAANCEKLLELCKAEGLPVKITCTVRDQEKQTEYYKAGTGSKIVTFHKVGVGLAFDICKNISGHAYDDLDFFRKCAVIGKKIGFSWGGDWTSRVDMPHFQWDEHGKYGGDDITAGRYPPEMPLYEEEEEMTQEEFDKMMADWQARNNPAYANISDVPTCWKDETKVLMDAGAINGGTEVSINPNDVNMRQDALKAAIICKRYVDGKTVK